MNKEGCPCKTHTECLRMLIGKPLAMLDEGAQAVVYSVSSTVVAKVYNAGKDAEQCHAVECEMLQKLEATGIAPRLLSSFVCHTHDVRGLLLERISLVNSRPADYNKCSLEHLTSEEQQAIVKTICTMLQANVLQNDAHLGNWGFRTTLAATPVLFDYGHAVHLTPKRTVKQDALLLACTLSHVLEDCKDCNHDDGFIIETLDAAVYLAGFTNVDECTEAFGIQYPDALY